jgi:murein L,D-transpeptidase YcbB/YkuD
MTVSRSRTRSPIHPARRPAVTVHGKLAVDGAMGPRTTRATQRWVGTPADGQFGPRSVRALQRKVGVRPAGTLGWQTIRALQVRIGARRDGARRLNSHTVSSLQRYLNSH